MAENGVDWSGYIPYDPPYAKPHRDLTRREASASFDHYLASQDERFDALGRLLRRNGLEVSGVTREGLAKIDSWYRSAVRTGKDGEFVPYWNGVSHDVGRYFGECLCRSFDWLRWELLTRPKSDFSYQRPVVVGFKNAGYAFVADPEHVVRMLGHIYASRGYDETAGTVIDTYDIWAGLA